MKGLAERHVPKATARALYEETTPPLPPEILEARRLERLLAPRRDEKGGKPSKKERRHREKGARLVRRPRRAPRLLYEILLLADLVAVVLLLRFRARMASTSSATLLDTRGFVLYLGRSAPPRRDPSCAPSSRRAGAAGAACAASRRAPEAAVPRRPSSASSRRRRSRAYVYSWLKVAAPPLRPDVLFDHGSLPRFETALHFGVNPGRPPAGPVPVSGALGAASTSPTAPSSRR